MTKNVKLLLAGLGGFVAATAVQYVMYGNELWNLYGTFFRSL